MWLLLCRFPIFVVCVWFIFSQREGSMLYYSPDLVFHWSTAYFTFTVHPHSVVRLFWGAITNKRTVLEFGPRRRQIMSVANGVGYVRTGRNNVWFKRLLKRNVQMGGWSEVTMSEITTNLHDCRICSRTNFSRKDMIARRSDIIWGIKGSLKRSFQTFRRWEKGWRHSRWRIARIVWNRRSAHVFRYKHIWCMVNFPSWCIASAGSTDTWIGNIGAINNVILGHIVTYAPTVKVGDAWKVQMHI